MKHGGKPSPNAAAEVATASNEAMAAVSSVSLNDPTLHWAGPADNADAVFNCAAVS